MMLQGDAFSRYSQCLVQLHSLIRRGEGDSDPADTLRDKMDGFWDRLSPLEVTRVEGLSADLYSIGEEAGPEDESFPGEGLNTRFQEAEARGDWDGALELLRRSAPSLPDPRVAFQRGVYWANLGGAELALPFLEYAVRADPKPSSLLKWLLTLSQLGLYEELARLVIVLAESGPKSLAIPGRLVETVWETLRLHEQLREIQSHWPLPDRGDFGAVQAEYRRIESHLRGLQATVKNAVETLAAA